MEQHITVQKESVEADAEIQLVGKWKGKGYQLSFHLASTIFDVKTTLESYTNVLVKRQKLVGLNHKGRPAPNHMTLGELKIKNMHKFMLIGTVEKDIFVDPCNIPQGDLPSVICDFGFNCTMGSKEWQNIATNTRLLEKCCSETVINVMNAPRGEKPLLVLDLDHTLLDFSTDATDMASLKRPGMDDFLASVFRNYDIVIWSQTSWRWLEIKLTELGMLTNPGYHISFVLDKTSMFTFSDSTDPRRKTHQVKALELIWKKFPGRWSAVNTIHIDDLSRNFAMNPKNGIKISAFYTDREGAANDRELSMLALYLNIICAPSPDFTKLNNRRWKKALREHQQRGNDCL